MACPNQPNPQAILAAMQFAEAFVGGFADGFPTEPIGGGNPYHRCACCKRSVPEINCQLLGHTRDCAWRRLTEAGAPMAYGSFPDDNLMELITCHQCGRDLYPGDAGFGERGCRCPLCREKDDRGET
jgi:hypothetical protein